MKREVRNVKKWASGAILLILLSFVFHSCMQWEPTNPRRLFGSWHLYEMEIDGEKDDNYNQDITISFAGEVFLFAYIERSEIFGSFNYDDGMLTLDASYHAGGGFNVPYLYNPFPVGMMFPDGDEIVTVDLPLLADTRMEWVYIDKYGRTVKAYFRKSL